MVQTLFTNLREKELGGISATTRRVINWSQAAGELADALIDLIPRWVSLTSPYGDSIHNQSGLAFYGHRRDRTAELC